MTEWVVFDYDGTLTTHRSGWTLLHAVFGTHHVQSERIEAYHEGSLSFEKWAELDVQGWIKRGATKTDIEQVAQAVKIRDNTERVLGRLRESGYRFGVLSGGLEELTVKIQRFNPDFTLANSLKFDDGGNLVGVKKMVGPSAKGDILLELGEKHGFDLSDVLFVGDGRNDVEAFQVAGKAILFDPLPSLTEEERKTADAIIEEEDLSLLFEHL